VYKSDWEIHCVYCAVRTGSLNTNHFITLNLKCLNREISQAVSRRLLTGFNHRLVHVGFVVKEVAIGQDFSEYFSFRCQYHSTKASHTYSSYLNYKRARPGNLPKIHVPHPPRNFGKIWKKKLGAILFCLRVKEGDWLKYLNTALTEVTLYSTTQAISIFLTFLLCSDWKKNLKQLSQNVARTLHVYHDIVYKLIRHRAHVTHTI
jgi:hypothetical protein